MKYFFFFLFNLFEEQIFKQTNPTACHRKNKRTKRKKKIDKIKWSVQLFSELKAKIAWNV